MASIINKDTIQTIMDSIQLVVNRLTGKTDKVANATAGNFAGLDSNGGLIDSGHKHDDYVTGVKGNSESTYRSGNVNLTAADVGALPDATVPVNKGGTGATTAENAILNLFGSDSQYRMKYVSGEGTVGGITSPYDGLAIWQENDESAGIILTGDGIYIFAPPDETALSFINEDNNKVAWSIDGDGALRDSNGNEIYMRGGAYLPLSGGTMTGSLTFANGTKNVVGDDCAIGDIDAAGTLGVQGQNGTTTIGLLQNGTTWGSSSNRCNITFDGTINQLKINKPLDIQGEGPNAWSEGLRIHQSNSGWCCIELCHSDNTGSSGVSANSWGLFKNPDANFSINKGDSGEDVNNYLSNSNNAWHFKAGGGPVVTIDSSGYISGVVHYNMSSGTQDQYVSDPRIVYANSDNWFRYMSVSKLKDLVLGWTYIGNTGNALNTIRISPSVIHELLIDWCYDGISSGSYHIPVDYIMNRKSDITIYWGGSGNASNPVGRIHILASMIQITNYAGCDLYVYTR